MSTHEHRTQRHPVVFRTIQVQRTERLTPHMQRIVFGGEALRGFHSASPDDHAKLFFPNSLGELVPPALGPNGPEYPPGREPSPARDYTPRHHDEARNELTIDFVLHGTGPAALWATQAAPGQSIGLGGPRGSFLVAGDYARYVLVGDETALPAIGRWLDEAGENTLVHVLAEIPDDDDRQPLTSRARHQLDWLSRGRADAAASDLLERALQTLPDVPQDTFYWIAAESRRARAMRQYLSLERGVPKESIRATGYWKSAASQADDE